MTHLFTLSGGHLFSIYDGCKAEGIEIVDVRHEQTAAFAAEGFAKATRGVGVAALTAGPGVTNGISAIAGAQANCSPVCVLGGRAPEMRWGSGSLQEIDHLPFVSPLVKSAETVKEPGEIGARTAAALDLALGDAGRADLRRLSARRRLHRGRGRDSRRRRRSRRGPAEGVEEAAALLASAERPAIMAGSGLYWGRGEEELRALAEALGIPVFLNGLGRGCLPADHELAFSRARGAGLGGADVALVIGVPLDFRLGFGASIAEEAKLIRLDAAPNELSANRAPQVDLVGDVAASLAAIREALGSPARRTDAWLAQLRKVEEEKRAAEQAELERRPLAAAPGAGLQGAGRSARARRDRRRRRRRLRLLRRPLHRYLPAGLLDGPGSLRLPRRRARARRSAPSWPIPTARSACCSATAPSASPGWSSTRWPATACRSSA